MFYSKGRLAQQHVLSHAFSAHVQRPKETIPVNMRTMRQPVVHLDISQWSSIWIEQFRSTCAGIEIGGRPPCSKYHGGGVLAVVSNVRRPLLSGRLALEAVAVGYSRPDISRP
jgi:hypothetical protein